MSRKKRPQRPPRKPNPPKEPRAVWVTSDLNPDGSASYIVTVSATDDCALSLKADAAVRYCVAVNRAAVIAQHDAAVIAQLSSKSPTVSVETAAATVADLRKDRLQAQDSATAPFRFEPIVSSTSGRPYVHMWANGERISQWSPEDCFRHAAQVMQVLAGVDLDSAYFRYLVDTIGIEAPRAHAVVHDLGNYSNGIRHREPPA